MSEGKHKEKFKNFRKGVAKGNKSKVKIPTEEVKWLVLKTKL